MALVELALGHGTLAEEASGQPGRCGPASCLRAPSRRPREDDLRQSHCLHRTAMMRRRDAWSRRARRSIPMTFRTFRP